MIERLKKAPPALLLALTGIAFYFSELALSLELTSAAAYISGVSYGALIVSVSLGTIVFAALIAKLLIYISFRIGGAIFTRKSGMLYPFPITYGDYTRTTLVFACLCLTVCGVLGIPDLFFPTLTRVSSAIRSVVTWLTLALIVRYFLKHNAHDYDKKALAFALGVIPLVLVCVTVVLTIVEVIR